MTEKIGVFSRAIYWEFWVKVTKAAASLLASILIVRMLGKEQYGLLSVVRIFVSYAMIFYTLGLNETLLRYLPEARLLGSKGGASRLLGKTFCLQTVLWLIFLGGVLFFSKPISTSLGGGVEVYLWVAVALSFFSFLQISLSNALTTFYEVKTQVFSGALATLVLLGLLYGMLSRGLGIWSIFFSEAIVGAGLSLWFLKRLWSLSVTPPSIEKKAPPIPLSRVLKFSIPLVCLTVVNQIIWRQSELFFLAHYHKPAVVGLYNVGFSFPQLVLEFVPSFLGIVGIVGAAEQFIQGVDHLAKAITWFYKILFFLLAPLVTGGALFSDQLILLLYGADFASAGMIARIYFVLFVFVFLLTPYGLAIYAEERVWRAVAISTPVCLLNLVLDFFWIRQFGIWGAVWAVGVTNIVGFFVSFFSWKKIFPYLIIPWRFIGKCFLATTPFLFLLPLKDIFDHLLWFLFLCVLMGGLYLLGVRWIKLFGEEDLRLLGEAHIPARAKLLKFLKG